MSKLLLDTNVLVRLATNDDQHSAEEAIQCIAALPKNSVEVHESVLSEVCFVLEFHDYKMKRSDIADFFETLFGFSQIIKTDRISDIIEIYRSNSKLDFVDCVLVHESSKNEIFTFDKILRKAIDAR